MSPSFDTPRKASSVEKESELRWNVSATTLHKDSRKNSGENEDAILVRSEEGIFGVFDGMGGHVGGRVASQAVKKYIEEHAQELSDGLSLQEIQIRMDRVLYGANTVLLRMVDANSDLHSMGTTASVVKVWKGSHGECKIIVGNVGDSRVSLLKANGTFVQVSVDDSIGSGKDEQQVRAIQERLSQISRREEMTDRERMLFNGRNIITQSLGDAKVKPRIFTSDFEAGDRFIITSDGVHDNLTSSEIVNALRLSQNRAKDSDALIVAAVSRSRNDGHLRAKPDDMSAIVVEYPRLEKESSQVLSQFTEALRSSRLAKLIAGFTVIAGIGGVYEATRSHETKDPVHETAVRERMDEIVDGMLDKQTGERVGKAGLDMKAIREQAEQDVHAQEVHSVRSNAVYATPSSQGHSVSRRKPSSKLEETTVTKSKKKK